MIRTQVYLTEAEKNALDALVAATGKSRSELIRTALDSFLEQYGAGRCEAAIKGAAGMWKYRTDLPDYDALRSEWDRAGRT
jgi:metal-responsive CopG/Arc/MetJ family transcriptional regulator